MGALSLCLDCRQPARGTRCPECAKRRENARSSRRGASGWERQRANAQIVAAAGGRCGECGGAASVVDHVVPLALGGTDDATNKRALCKKCHARVTREQFGGGGQP